MKKTEELKNANYPLLPSNQGLQISVASHSLPVSKKPQFLFEGSFSPSEQGTQLSTGFSKKSENVLKIMPQDSFKHDITKVQQKNEPIKKQNFIMKSSKGKTQTFYVSGTIIGETLTKDVQNPHGIQEKNYPGSSQSTKSQSVNHLKSPTAPEHKKDDESFSSDVSGGFSSDSNHGKEKDHKQQISESVLSYQSLHDEGCEVKQRRHYLEDLPPQPIVNKPYSLEADMIFGWKPKIQFNGPIPLNFKNDQVDRLIREIGQASSNFFGQFKLCYIGFRPYTSLHMHQHFSGNENYHFRYDHLFQNNYNLAPFFDQFSKKFRKPEKPLFQGNNPLFLERKDFLKFDSAFESGNLDAAVKIENLEEYDLFMRVDANTRGHFQWYNFKVTQGQKQKKVKFNICNFKKKKSLYMRGMKPYIFSQQAHKIQGQGWIQAGNNVEYKSQPFRYTFLRDDEEHNGKQPFCLSFEYEFQYDNDTVQIAFCVPYTFSMLTKFLKTQVSNHHSTNSDYITEEKLCSSMSGVDVPLLTITDNKDMKMEYSQRKVVLISARIHPGESNGSWMMQGFLQFLLGNSEAAKKARQNTIFKIVPMLNPDGVIMGNYRTGFSGRDLNRVFHTSDKILFPTIVALKDLTLELKRTYGNQFNLFIDLHGHSVKRNVFAYGPEFPIYDLNYYKCRIFPKLLAQKTDMFRFYSCIFKISPGKKNTGRAIFFNQFNIQLCYTIEASNGSFSRNGFTKPFTQEYLIEMGSIIGLSLERYVSETIEYEIKLALKATKFRNAPQIVQTVNTNINPIDATLSETDKCPEKKDVVKKKKNKDNKNEKEKKKKKSKINKTANQNRNQTNQEDINDLPFSQLLGLNNLAEKPLRNDESDGYSEGGSDSESSDEDYDKEDLKEMRNNLEINRNLFQQVFSSKMDTKQKNPLIRDSSRQNHQKKKRNISLSQRDSLSNSRKNSSSNESHEIKVQEKKGIYASKNIQMRPQTANINRKNINIQKIDEETNVETQLEPTNEIRQTFKSDSRKLIMSKRNLQLIGLSEKDQQTKALPLSSRRSMRDVKSQQFFTKSVQNLESQNKFKKESLPAQQFCFLPEAFQNKDNNNSNSFFDSESTVNKILKPLALSRPGSRNIKDKANINVSNGGDIDHQKGNSQIIFFQPDQVSEIEQVNSKKLKNEGSRLRHNCPSAFYAIKKHFDQKKREEYSAIAMEPITVLKVPLLGNNKILQTQHTKIFGQTTQQFTFSK